MLEITLFYIFTIAPVFNHSACKLPNANPSGTRAEGLRPANANSNLSVILQDNQEPLGWFTHNPSAWMFFAPWKSASL